MGEAKRRALPQGLGDGPIEPRYKSLMNDLAIKLDQFFNGPRRSPKATGFILLVFPFEGHEGRCNYISNTKREDVVVLLKEQLARFESGGSLSEGSA